MEKGCLCFRIFNKNTIVKNINLKTLLFLGSILLSIISLGANHNQNKNWSLTFDQKSKTLAFKYKNKDILRGAAVRFKISDHYVITCGYPKIGLTTSSINGDKMGKGEKIIYSYSGLKDYLNVEQIFYLYENLPYILAEVYLIATDKIRSNHIAPIVTKKINTFLKEDNTNRILTVPYDNDNFVSYLSHPLSVEDISSEITAVFNGRNRHGFIARLVEHDTWKTGIHYSTKFINKLSRNLRWTCE